MFNFLKEKLGGWIKKLSPQLEEAKKPKKKSKITKKPEPIKEKKKSASIKGIGETILKDIKKEGKEIKKQFEQEEVKEEVIKELKLEEKKPGFLSKLFGKKQEVKEEHIEEPEKPGFFDFFKSKITEEKFEELFSDLELALLQNNVAISAVDHIKKTLKQDMIGKSPSDINIKQLLKKALEDILINPPNLIKLIKDKLKEKRPFIIAFVGINGSGKTTSIAKVASLLKKQKLSVVLAAADTFRAASIEQLEQHASRLNIPIIKKDYNSDPASVGFEAIAHAKKHNIDVVLIDTAGRLNTKDSLMKEMEKIIRVCNPDLKIFVGESITGNDATEQAKAFNDSISLDGVILSKADVDEKGGTSISISKVTGKPIFFLGTGQSYDDLELFNKATIIKQLGL